MTQNGNRDRERELSGRSKSDFASNKMLLLGMLLLFAHLLEIRADEVSAAGLKIAIEDPIILRGMLAAVYLHYVFLAFWNFGHAYANQRRADRYRICRATLRFLRRRKTYDPHELKRSARAHIKKIRIVVWPHRMALFLVFISATILAIWDVAAFAVYLIVRIV